MNIRNSFKTGAKKVKTKVTTLAVCIFFLAAMSGVGTLTADANTEAKPSGIFEKRELNHAPTAMEYVPDEILVKFKPDLEGAAITRLGSEYRTSVKSTLPSGTKLLKIPQGKTVEEMVAIYERLPEVVYAEPNYIDHILMVPDDSYYSYQWHLENAEYGGIHMESAWDRSIGSGVVVAVIDSGVAYENYDVYCQAPDLAGTTFVQGYDFVNDDAHPNDDNGHGTHVAGTIAQTTNNNYGVAGVAFGCSIMPVKTLNATGTGSHANFSSGVHYAVDHGADIISYSGGGVHSSTKQEAVEYAYTHGVTFIAAAGNDYEKGNAPNYPAAYDDYVIAVGATRYDETRSYYSNTGSYLDLVAPGGDTRVDQNHDGYVDGVLQQTFSGGNPCDFGLYFLQGTSMATPHASGVAALLIANGVTGPDNVRTILQSTAEDKGVPGWDAEYGLGLLDAEAALNAAQINISEAVDNYNLTFFTDGDADWFGQTVTQYHDGDAAESGNISDNQDTWVRAAVTGPGALSFYWKVSSEADYDYLRFYIDDMEQDAISGSTSWAPMTYPISSGAHTLMWKYSKDEYVSSGADCGWIDKVEYCTTENPDIWIDPTSFDVARQPDTIYSTNLTIGNAGNGTLTFEITDTGGVSSIPEPTTETEFSGLGLEEQIQEVEGTIDGGDGPGLEVASGEYELAYDDGELDYYHSWSGAGGAFGVHFTSPIYSTLSTVRFYIHSDPVASDWTVLSWTGSQPGSVIASGTTKPASSGWHEVDVGNISVPSEFVIAIYWKEANRPTLGSDADPPIASRSWKYNGVAWSAENTVDYMIRAVMSPEAGWLSESPTNGTVEATAQTNITVTFNTAGLSVDDYHANITITNNDPDENPVIIPVHLTVESSEEGSGFDTGSGTYPSISGVHNGTITPNQTITVSKLYTYPCAGTGGHSEHVRIYNESGTLTEGHWTGYQGDYHNITLPPSITLLKDYEYNYTIRTGSYPQIIHAESKEVTGGTITCTEFTDANGKVYTNWIPAIRLF